MYNCKIERAFVKKIKHKIFCTIVFVITFIVVLFIGTVVSSKFELSELFKKGRPSVLDNRSVNLTHDIVVDLTFIWDQGGILTLTENVLRGLISKRPNWRVILLISKETNSIFNAFASFKNVKIVNVKHKYSDIHCFVFKVLDWMTLGTIHDKLLQSLFYNKLFIDDKCDLFWDPASGLAFNHFTIPKVSTIHDLAYIDIRNNVSPNVANCVAKRTAELMKVSDQIITVSNFSKKRILEEFKVKDEFVKIIPIKMAKRLKNLSSSSTIYILKKYNLINNRYLIYVSSLWGNKNHNRLLKAFARFIGKSSNKLRNKSDLKLLIIGQHELFTFENFVKDLNLENNVIFTGFIPKEDLNVLLSNAIAFIHPSLYEGFGMPIVEAMAVGLPIACSIRGSLPEIACKAALYFDPYNIDEIEKAIYRIITDNNLRKLLTERGYERVKTFMDNDSMINDYISVFENVMNNNTDNRQVRKTTLEYTFN